MKTPKPVPPSCCSNVIMGAKLSSDLTRLLLSVSKLLPIPDSLPISPDDGEHADIYKLRIRVRGNLEWAPPRPQIIFNIHPAPKWVHIMFFHHSLLFTQFCFNLPLVMSLLSTWWKYLFISYRVQQNRWNIRNLNEFFGFALIVRLMSQLSLLQLMREYQLSGDTVAVMWFVMSLWFCKKAASSSLHVVC